MRVTNQMQHQMMSRYIADNQAAASAKQEEIASGKRMRTASEDPRAWAAADRLRQLQTQLNGYEERSVRLTSQLTSMDSSLSAIGTILQSASEKSVAASSGTLNATDRTNLAGQIDQLLEELVQQANAKFDGHYQLGGTQTAQPPFAVTRNSNGQIGAVAYAGNAEVSVAAVGENDAVPQQLAGGGSQGVLVSESTDAFAALIELRDRLNAGENPADSSVQGRIDASLENVLTSRARVGAYLEHLKLSDSIRNSRQTQLASQLSATEGVDIASAVSELAAKNVAYEAALSISAQTMKTSLLNYI